MPGFFKYITIFVLLLVFIFVLGPVVDIDTTVKPISLPDDIDAFLHDSESQFADIRPQVEKTIRWIDPSDPQQSQVAIVYLHGFSASRQEVAPLGDKLASALNANRFYTRLTGHGRGSEAMREMSVTALLNDAVEAMEIGRRIGKRVVLVGTSTGGTLATWLAMHDAHDSILATVLISPNFGPKRPESELLLLPWGRNLLHLVEGPTYRFTPANEQHARFWTIEFPSDALLPMMGLVKLVRESPLENITTPTLVFYSPDDRIVDVSAILENVHRFGTQQKQLVRIDQTGDPQRHVLAGDILSPQTTDFVAESIVDFLQPLL